MRFVGRHLKLIVVATSCAVVGAGASVIASAGAANSSSQRTAGKALLARAGVRRALRRAVHGELVVPTKTGFATVTLDRGVVQAVSGAQLTLREATKRATYKTITLTIPANARIRVDRRKATFTDLKAGQRALVLQGPKRTLVVARDVRTP
jgi:hypothetical protein